MPMPTHTRYEVGGRDHRPDSLPGQLDLFDAIGDEVHLSVSDHARLNERLRIDCSGVGLSLDGVRLDLGDAALADEGL